MALESGSRPCRGACLNATGDGVAVTPLLGTRGEAAKARLSSRGCRSYTKESGTCCWRLDHLSGAVVLRDRLPEPAGLAAAREEVLVEKLLDEVEVVVAVRRGALGTAAKICCSERYLIGTTNALAAGAGAGTSAAISLVRVVELDEWSLVRARLKLRLSFARDGR